MEEMKSLLEQFARKSSRLLTAFSLACSIGNHDNGEAAHPTYDSFYTVLAFNKKIKKVST